MERRLIGPGLTRYGDDRPVSLLDRFVPRGAGTGPDGWTESEPQRRAVVRWLLEVVEGYDNNANKLGGEGLLMVMGVGLENIYVCEVVSSNFDRKPHKKSIKLQRKDVFLV